MSHRLDVSSRPADTVLLLLCQPRPRGRRVAVVTASSAAAASADAALESVGLVTAAVTQHTEMRTRLIVPDATHTGGLVILPATTNPAKVGLVLSTLAEDPGVDAVISAMDLGHEARHDLAQVLHRVSRTSPGVTIVSAGPLDRGRAARLSGTVPTLPDLQRAAAALANSRFD